MGVVLSGVISPLIWVISVVTLLITPLIPAHEPPSRLQQASERMRAGFWEGCFEI